ncbi:hypothetical protein OAA09_00955 [bacterium]|nr:hypothetical protein [bacterium]
MKITKDRVRQIIREELKEALDSHFAKSKSKAGRRDSKPFERHAATKASRQYGKAQALDQLADKDEHDYDMAEFTRGEQDGFSEKPYNNPSGNTSYHSGYEDGAHAASMDDDKDEYRGFHEAEELDEARLGGDLDDISAPGDHPFFTGKPKTRRISYQGRGYRGRRIISRDRAWLEFVPKGNPSETSEDMFRAVTLLKPTDPEIQKALDGARPDLVRSIGDLDQYDVYSVYATTTG